PEMHSESPAQMVTHLDHPNGWWRDTAQRMLIVKGDTSVVPALIEMASSNPNHLARLHALWTLEGLDALTPDLIRAKLKDEHGQLRIGAIRAAETLLKKGDISLIADVKPLKADKDPNVVLQVIMTSKLLKWPEWKNEAQSTLAASMSMGVRDIGAQLLVEAPTLKGKFTNDEKKQLERGQDIFRSLCFACHGFDGTGMPMPGRPGVTLAPPLAGSKTVVQGDSILRVMMNGLSGPINGKTYEAQMVTMASNNDQWIADVSSYIRKAFGNNGKMVSKKEVEKLRSALKNRALPWTIEELAQNFPQPLTNRNQWKITASHKERDVGLAVDGDMHSRWTSGTSQAPGMWLQIELPEATDISGLVLDSGNSHNDYPRGYNVELSMDGKDWGAKPSLEGKGEVGMIEFMLATPAKTKFIRITQTGQVKGLYWSVHELDVLGVMKQ
ncbi:MAG: hypothetical protein JWO89_302, partial [Verrucomicrobiaceae bacterium]|nr:hypothetical protein [Verrucomicrobiaceae bacterium]